MVYGFDDADDDDGLVIPFWNYANLGAMKA